MMYNFGISDRSKSKNILGKIKDSANDQEYFDQVLGEEITNIYGAKYGSPEYNKILKEIKKEIK